MQRPILHRHPDGSGHYTYCCGEDNRQPYRFEWLRPRRLAARPRRTKSGWALLISGFGLATAMFWSTMLVSPPTSEATASLTASTWCSDMERPVRLWLDKEIQHRAQVSNVTGHDNFHQMLLWYRSAHTQCAAGDARGADGNFKALERMVAEVAARQVLADGP